MSLSTRVKSFNSIFSPFYSPPSSHPIIRITHKFLPDTEPPTNGNKICSSTTTYGSEEGKPHNITTTSYRSSIKKERKKFGNVSSPIKWRGERELSGYVGKYIFWVHIVKSTSLSISLHPSFASIFIFYENNNLLRLFFSLFFLKTTIIYLHRGRVILSIYECETGETRHVPSLSGVSFEPQRGHRGNFL